MNTMAAEDKPPMQLCRWIKGTQFPVFAPSILFYTLLLFKEGSPARTRSLFLRENFVVQPN